MITVPVKYSKDFIEKFRSARAERIAKLPIIPKEISKMINKHTEETYKLNEGNLDKDAFRLGMYAM